jgi:copper resistance protein D
VISEDSASAGIIIPVLLLTRWVHFASLLILFGSALYWLSMPGEFPRARHLTEKLLCCAAPAALVSGLAWLCVILANMAGGFGAVVDRETLADFFATQMGLVAGLRLILLGMAAAIALWPRRDRGWLVAMLAASASLLVEQAWLGHAATGGVGLTASLLIVVYCVHVLAAGAWIGGLPPLLFTLKEARATAEAETGRLVIEVLSRFSLMGVVAVTAIVVSAVGDVALRVGWSFAILFHAGYGAVLLAKIALVAVMLGLAWYNRFIALPRLRIATALTNDLKRLEMSVGGEIVLGLGVIAAAAVLGLTPPPQ